jgi:hypothetical protein
MSQQKDEMPPADPKDVASIDAIITALYDVISGPKGETRNWNRLRTLFFPGARMIPTATRPTGESGPRVLDVEGFIANVRPYVEEHGFYEREIARRVDSFGKITQAFSSYDSRHKAEDPEPFSRGINSIQLVFDNSRWWVVTVFWDAETPDNPIPQKYLESKSD